MGMDSTSWSLSWEAAIVDGRKLIASGDETGGFQMVVAGLMGIRFPSRRLINLPTQRREDNLVAIAEMKTQHWGAGVEQWMLWPRRGQEHSSYVLTVVIVEDPQLWDGRISRVRTPVAVPPQILVDGRRVVDCSYGLYLGEPV